MSSDALPVATLLDQGAQGYAAYVTHHLFESRPEAKKLYPRGPFEAWKAKIAAKLMELAVAVEFESPSLFAAAVVWSRDAFTSRGVSTVELEAALRSMAAVLEEELPAGVGDDLPRYFEAAHKALAEGVDETLEDPDLGPLALKYLEACLSGEPDRAREMIWKELDGGLSLADAVLGILVPAQREIGRLWHLGELGVHEERLVSAVTQELMVLLRSRIDPPGPDARSVVGGAIQGNSHDFGVRTVLDLFAFSGWKTINLGSNLPVESIASTVRDLQPDVVLLSVTLVTQLRLVPATVTAIRNESDKARILVGGGAFQTVPDLWKKLGADGFASGADQAVRVAEDLFR